MIFCSLDDNVIVECYPNFPLNKC
uniref:Uncharacterized protein n=1 Tax=Anguilla anguilla TaxID=7936 RepID=A0A0E9Y0C8_ANGAN